MFKVNNKANSVVLVCLLLTLNIFYILFFVSVANFEHVIAGWVTVNKDKSLAEEEIQTLSYLKWNLFW